MPPFTRKRPTEISPAASPPASGAEAQLVAAQTALDALLDERTRLQQSRVEQQQQRDALMHSGAALEQITAIDRSDYQAGLRAAQIDLRLPELQDALTEARQVVHRERWLAFRPRVAGAQQHLAETIGALFTALDNLRAAHDAAHRAGFGGHLHEFLRVPPGGNGINTGVVSDHALRAFQKAATGRASALVDAA